MDNPDDSGTPYVSPFESVRGMSDEGFEYWSARDLAKKFLDIESGVISELLP